MPSEIKNKPINFDKLYKLSLDIVFTARLFSIKMW